MNQLTLNRSYLGREIPLDWIIARMGKDGIGYRNALSALSVIESAAKEQDNRRWLHVSVSHPNRLPTWDELKRVKSIWIGEDHDAFQVLPKASKYVNIDPHCLHLWHPLDHAPFPDFTRGGRTL